MNIKTKKELNKHITEMFNSRANYKEKYIVAIIFGLVGVFFISIAANIGLNYATYFHAQLTYLNATNNATYLGISQNAVNSIEYADSIALAGLTADALLYIIVYSLIGLLCLLTAINYGVNASELQKQHENTYS